MVFRAPSCFLKAGSEWGEVCVVAFCYRIELLNKRNSNHQLCWGGGGCKYSHYFYDVEINGHL